MKSNSDTCELVYIQQARVDMRCCMSPEHEHSISTAPYKRSKAPVWPSDPIHVSTRQTLPSWRCTRSDLHGIRLSANSYQLVVSSGLEPSALDDKHGTAGMTQQVFGPLEEPLWGVDPLISGSKVVGHVTWTPALGGRNLRWIDCFCREVTASTEYGACWGSV